MTKGYNKANLYDKLRWVLESKEVKQRPCVFLSHKREDKPECKKIAEYLKIAEIDFYLDELDQSLQQASADNNAQLITECLKKGIRESTHMLVVVSERTYLSQWVPFEVGYGHAAIVDKYIQEENTENKIKLAVLTLKDLSEKTLPDFMQVGYLIRGTKSLNEYISKIDKKRESLLINEKRLFSNNMIGHSLDSILNWKL